MSLLPKAVQIKEEECTLGGIDIDGLPKRFKKNGPDYMTLKERYNDLQCVLNGHKPCCTISYNFPERYRPDKDTQDYIQLLLHLRGTQAKMIPYNRDTIYDFNKGLKKETVDSINLMWLDKKHERSTLLLAMVWNDQPTKEEEAKIMIIHNKFKELLKKNISAYDYINGTLLGYRKGEIRGYLLRDYSNYKIIKKYGPEKAKQIRQDRNMWMKKVKEVQKDMPHFDEYYASIKKGCDVWIHHMLTKSKVFQKFVDRSQDSITGVILPKIEVEPRYEKEFLEFYNKHTNNDKK